MRLGIAGPVDIAPFEEYLHRGAASGGPTPIGLGGTPVIHLALELLKRKWKLTIFTLSPDVLKEVVLEGPQLKICVGPYRLRHRARDYFRTERLYLREAIHREQPDLVHAHWTYEFALAALETGVPTLVTCHDAPLNILRWNPSPYRLVRTVMAAETARKATAMTAVSPYTANHFRRYMFYRGEMPTIPNGIPAWIFALGKERRRTVTHAGITYATVLSGWDRLKNGRTALVAFSHLRPAIPDARFILFGHGHGVGEEGHVWAEAKGLAEGVEFAGQTPHAVMLQRLAREVDLLLHPSLEESFSMAVIEGMALGIPVIGGARSGAVPTTIGDAGGGVLVDVRSSSAMSGAMLDLAFHSSRRIAMGVAARESAIQRFAIGSVAVAYEREYSALASQR